MKIIDVSKWQGSIDWKKVKGDDVGLAILRASCDVTKDSKLDEYVKGCKQNNIPFGVYHYLQGATATSAKCEAKAFYNSAKAHNPAFWVLDFEDTKIVNLTTSKKKEVAKAFVDQLRKCGAERIVIYTWEWLGKLLPDETFGWAWRWYASYGKNTGVPTSVVNGCSLHQYSSKGKVKGINTSVDLSQLKDGATVEALISPVQTISEEPKQEVKEENKTSENGVQTVIKRLLQYGSVGEDVKWLQGALNKAGYNCGTVDGIFGQKTLAAVRKFQKAKKLSVDGVAGKITVTALGGNYK